MQIHEYQAKELFRQYLIPVPAGRVAHSVQEVEAIVAGLPKFPVAVKSQIHGGGRGQGGGIQLAATLAEAQRLTALYLGMTLVTPQTGPQGKVVHKVLIEQAKEIAQELYLTIFLDRPRAEIVLLAVATGGEDVEELARRAPERLIKVRVNPLLGLQPYHCQAIFFGLRLAPVLRERLSALLRHCYRLFTECDCTLLEINPLAITPEGGLFALDAKLEFDPNGLLRHPELLVYRDLEEEEPIEAAAAQYQLHYIKLAGTIGTMANGAGLAMATLDLLNRAGGAPANFLDIGGGANPETIANGFRLLARDQQVKGILINIFGGLLRCDRLARSVVEVVRELAVPVPIVLRMEGTNVVTARKIVAESGLKLVAAATLGEATSKVIGLAAV